MTAHKASDAGDADSGERARNSRRRRSCEKELVVLSAVEGELEGAAGCGPRATRLRGVGLLHQGRIGSAAEEILAPTPDLRQRWARSVERPSLRSMQAVARRRRSRARPTARRG